MAKAARPRSPQRGSMTVENVYVAMSDGVRIGAIVHRPSPEGRYPALFAISPYQHAYNHLPAHALFPWRETGPIEWYVERGYAYVHADVRGSGRSEGEFGYLDRTEQRDYHELIEWIGRQPWSNGRVGGIGQSYYAVAQWHMAIQRPPSLKCIVPYDGAVDLYRDQVYHGGIYGEFRAGWYNMVRANNLLRAANAPTGKAMTRDLVGEMLTHQTYDDWWKERSPVERLHEIEVPVLSIGLWGKVGLHLRGNVLGYELLRCPKKLVVLGARTVEEAAHLFDQPEFHGKELLPFYDGHLKGARNQFMEGPAVRIFVRGADVERTEAEWPLERARYTPFYLRQGPSGSVTSLNDGSLSREAPKSAEKPTSYDYPDPEWRNGVVAMGKWGPDFVGRVLTFTSEALDDDLEVTGPIRLELYASSDQPDTDFFVKLADQMPQAADQRKEGRPPAFVNVTKGWLKASHRELDPTRAMPHRPVPSHADPQPLVPGRAYRFDIEIHPASYVFKRGHRIRLELANGDSRLTDSYFAHAYLPYKMGTDTVYHDAERPSRLMLPVVPASRKPP
jgi:putative CocE/NonD family hydrolase